MNSNDQSDNKTYNITTNGTTILPGKLVLIRIVVNTKGASSNTATIYDSTEAIGANAERKKGELDTTSAVGNVEYGFICYDGIYIDVNTGTAPDLTVIYKETP